MVARALVIAAVVFTTAIAAASQVPICSIRPSADRLIEALRWHAFWADNQTARSAKPGTILQATLLGTSDNWVVFIADLGARLTFARTGANSISKLDNATYLDAGSGSSNNGALQLYKRIHRIDCGGALPNSAPPQPQKEGSVLPNARMPCVGSAYPLVECTFQFQVSSLADLPESIRLKMGEESLPALKQTVVELLNELGKGVYAVSIPFFSESDPVVFVYIVTPRQGESVVAQLTMGNGKWELLKFNYNAGKNQLDDLISKIRAHTLASITIAID